MGAPGETIVGVVTFYPHGGPVAAPPEAQTPFPSTWAMFRLLAVALDRRGTGLGRLLTETCLSRARTLGATHLALHTSDVMALARAMYLRMGWQRAPQYDFYPTPELCVEAYSLAL
jgi:GNAT superfamily N-acetyltransferase